MAYQNLSQQYPYNYNPYQPQVPAPMDRLAYLQAQQYQTQQPNQSWAYVQGEAAAKSWWVGAGQSVLLLDSENPVFYIKSVDKSNVPLPLRIFDYKERQQNVSQPVPQIIQTEQIEQTNLDDKYATRQEYNELQGKYDDLQGKYIEILNRLDNFPVLPVASEGGRKPETATNKTRNRGGNADE